MKFYKFIFLLLLFNNYLFSTILEISDINKKVDLLPQSYILIDNKSTLNFQNITQMTFKENNKSIINFGINKEKTVWIKFTLKNTSNSKKELFLEHGSAITKEIELYDQDKVYKDGLLFINKYRDSFKPSFILNLEAESQKTYYLKVKSNNSSLSTKLNLWQKKAFEKEILKQNTNLNLFFGAIAILLIYNLFILVFTKHKSYLYYVAYILSIILHLSIYSGYSTLLIFEQETINFFINNQFLVVYLVVLTMSLFSSKLLDFDRFKKFNTVLKYYLIFISITTILSFNSLLISPSFYGLFLPIIVALLYKANYLVFKKKEKIALIYLIAWFPLLFISLGWLYLALSNQVLIWAYDIFIYILISSILFETVVFSIALAYRINTLQKRKEEADKKLLEEQKSIEGKLQKEVSLKTRNLTLALEEKELLLKELHHRVKNNLQMVNSLLRLQSFETKDEKTKEILLNAQNRVRAIGFLHELLYKQDNISYISTYEYFTILINELLKTSNKNVIVNYSINYDIELKDIIYCGLILNELVSNSLKHAFEKDGVIDISLNKKHDFYILTIKDNGKGYEQKKTNTLGLTLIESLVTKQLKGTIKLNTNNCVEVEIKWSNDE